MKMGQQASSTRPKPKPNLSKTIAVIDARDYKSFLIENYQQVETQLQNSLKSLERLYLELSKIL